MGRCLAICLLLATCLSASIEATEQPPVGSPLALPQYIQALDNALSAARKLTKDEPQKADELLKSLPSAWSVQVEGQSFQIPTQTIRRDLGAWQKKPDSASLDRIVQHLETLRYQAAGYEARSADFPSRRALLNNILSRREFSGVHGQTWVDRFKRRVNEFLLRLLGRALASSAIPAISNIFVYGLIVIAVLVLAYWMYRSLRESARLETIMPSAMPLSAKEWPIWVAEARASAARGDWRDAIHRVYWGGISFLEAKGEWRADSARTPREYLSLLPATSDHQSALRALTRKLEIVWYGMQTADADSFQQTLDQLEKLGCPCN